MILQHTVNFKWYNLDPNSFEAKFLLLYSAGGGGLNGWAVSTFVMISGALFLNPNKDITFKKLYTKNIFRIFTAFVFWSFFYACVWYFYKHSSILSALKLFVLGQFHLWFLYMIAGLYMIVPFLRKITESDTLTKYFLILSLVFIYLLPDAGRVISLFSPKCGKVVFDFADGFFMNFIGYYVFFFMLGYFLDKTDIPPKIERLIYFLGVVFGVLMTIIMFVLSYVFKNDIYTAIYSRFSVVVLMRIIALFVYCKKHLNMENKVIQTTSRYSFGIFLAHYGVWQFFKKLGPEFLKLYPVFSVPVFASAIFMISFMVSQTLNHIPVLKKYVV